VRTILRAALLLTVALIPQTPGLAAISSVSVSGDVISMCSSFTGTGTLALGNYSGTDVAGNTSFTVMCAFEASPTTNFTISGGNNYNHNTSQLCGGYACRWMKTGTDYLYYQLYQDSGKTQVWSFSTSTGTGNGINGATNTVTPAGNAANMTLSVYGDVPAGQYGSPVGSYSDSVTVTVNY
jgi:spore coat protein U-like protein